MRVFYFISVVVAITLFSSCVPHKKITYFQDLANDSTLIGHANMPTSTVQPGDLISITISSLSEDANQLFELKSTSDDPNFASNTYLVREDSTVQIPVLGEIVVAGMPTGDVSAKVSLALEPYLKDPTVVARIVNYRITLMGEVARPGVYPVPNEKISILEAIGLAGDLTIYGQRENVKIIRTKGGDHQVFMVDLTSGDLFSSPHYYLQNNDIVYVEPSKGRTSVDDNIYRVIPLIVSAATLAIVVIGFATSN